MDGIVITWQQLLVVGLLLVLFYVAELLFFLRRNRGERQISSDAERQVQQLQEDLASLREQLDGLKVRLAAQEHLRQPEREAIPVSGPVETPYALAIRLARGGAEVEALIEQCGISRGEADLIAALYRVQRRG